MGLDHGFHCRWTVTPILQSFLLTTVLYDLYYTGTLDAPRGQYTLLDT